MTQEANTNIDGSVQETAEAAAAPVIQFADGLIGVSTKFNFKTRVVLDANDKPVLNEKGEKIGVKQPSLQVLLPVPTADKLAEILLQPAVLQVPNADGSALIEKPNKVRQLIIDAVMGEIKMAAKSQFDDAIESFGSDTSKTLTPAHLDYDKLTLDYIASIEASGRASVAISDDEWKEFGTDYINTMLVITGKAKEKLVNTVEVFYKPTKVRGRKDLCALFLDQLAVYASATEKLEDFSAQIQYLTNRFKKFLDEEDKLVADAF